MRNKAEVLMHPVRMKILQALMQKKEDGLSTLEMISIIKDVPQATLYRHYSNFNTMKVLLKSSKNVKYVLLPRSFTR